MMNSVEGRVILVTGSNRGVGLEISRLLYENGAKVIGLSRSGITKEDRRFFCSYYQCDFSDLSLLNQTAKELIKAHTCLDGLISNAGFGSFGCIENFSIKQIDDFLKVNLMSHMVLGGLVAPVFKGKKSGDIIFMGSESSLRGNKYGSLYSAAKFGLRGFSQSLREETKNCSVRVSILNPGFIRTGFFDKLGFEPGRGEGSALDPKDIAQIILNILVMDSNCVVEELNISPQKKYINFK